MDEDYPKTLAELARRFGTEEACAEYLARLRWPDGFTCPRCRATDPWRLGNGLRLCRQCRAQVSVKAGTVFADSHLPLSDWFRAMWHITSQKNGASALGLQRVMGWGSYETAWTCLHKLRRAMVRPGRDRLQGVVEMDETFVGGERPGKRGRGAAGKSLVVIAVELLEPQGIGRIRLLRVASAAAAALTPAALAMVEPGSVVRTDDWNGYVGLASASYRREIIGPDAEPGENRLPCCHRVASLLKRWLLGTHQGAVRPKQLDYYLDEFTFRFNRRTSRSRGKLFYRLAQQAVQIEPQPYSRIIRRIPQQVGAGSVKETPLMRNALDLAVAVAGLRAAGGSVRSRAPFPPWRETSICGAPSRGRFLCHPDTSPCLPWSEAGSGWLAGKGGGLRVWGAGVGWRPEL